ncbi:PEP-CTERM sorting domain-containing protein [Massilia antarctica]|uniref:PEP-CTERM sorting domain-containing protein n=1 Tax=Massilia antarctica TaxID=2765360 RepID=A0AA48W9X9_9BURK|nr:PEP-CTERM sorting domain-containing protein [Massilia antarctica]QPI48537.1 PEP-CTERM sorting domain-containing protein [Massilia antarctica]
MAIRKLTLMHGACALMFAALAAGNASAQGTILTFEDQYPGFESEGELEPDYAGFNWSGSPGFVTSLSATTGGFRNGTIGQVGLVAYDGSVTFSRATAFNFLDSYVASAWRDGESVTVEGWRNGAMTYSSSFLVSTSQGKFAFNFTNVDKVSFRGEGGVTILDANAGEGAHLVLDNLSVSEISPVPEPATVWMLLGGSLVLLAAARRRKAHKA